MEKLKIYEEILSWIMDQLTRQAGRAAVAQYLYFLSIELKGTVMIRNTIPLFILSMVLLSACGPSVSLYSDMDDSANFDQYTTYNFMEFSEGNRKTITGMELERIRVAFAKEIETRGLNFAEVDGDVSVKITVYHRQAANAYGYSGVYHHLERAISVDMYDNLSMKHIWHCAAVGELEYDPEQRAAGLSDLVAMIFERYPVEAAEGI